MNRTIFEQPHRISHIKWIVVLLLPLVLAGHVHTADATPTAPVVLVNHALKQCVAKVFLADECRSCKPVVGWEILPTGQCPAEYKSITIPAEKDIPVSCVEYPRNEWAHCSWGRYPSVTPVSIATTGVPRSTVSATPPIPKFATVMELPSLTRTVQPSVEHLATPPAAPITPAITRYSFDTLLLAGLGCGILGVIITGFILLRNRRDKLARRSKIL
jgi:hypothetical protein